MHLVLFDIDGTLIDAGGIGMASLSQAAEEFFQAPDEVPPLDLAGSTDSGILRGLMEHFEVPHSEDGEREFFEIYLGRLHDNLEGRAAEGRVLPGVTQLLTEVSKDERLVPAILTGNTAGGAAAKLRTYGLAAHFSFGAYGDDHYDRNALGPVAIERAEVHTGIRFSGDECIVVGDTPKDILCGKAIGARTVAVATGKFSYDDLRGFDPDIALSDFSNTKEALDGLTA